jgi:hypothetical protein
MTFPLGSNLDCLCCARKPAAPRGAKVKPGSAASTSLFRTIIRLAYTGKASMLSFLKKRVAD